MDPSPPDVPGGRLARRARRRAELRGARLFEQIRADPDLRPRWDGNRVGTVVAAAFVHLFTVLLVAGVILVAVAVWPSPIGLLVAVGLAAMAWTVRPHFGRLAKSETPWRRTDLPALYEVLDRVAASTGGMVPDLVVIDQHINASWRTVGVRRRRVLTIGWPLWAAGSAQQQVALLGHEMAHEVNGDVTHSLLVGSAMLTLAQWQRLLVDGGRQVRPWARRSRVRDDVVRVFLVVLGTVPLLIRRLVEAAWDRTSQRAEYLADSLAARTGGAGAAAGMMEKVLLATSIQVTLQRAGRQGVADRVAYLRDHLAEVPAAELDRLRRVGELRGHRADTTHPPTHLRIAFLRALEAHAPAVTMTPDEALRVDAEVLSRIGACSAG